MFDFEFKASKITLYLINSKNIILGLIVAKTISKLAFKSDPH